MEKIIEKLKEISKQLQDLKKTHYSEGEEKYHQLDQIIQRIIDRIYPENDAKDLKNKMHMQCFMAGQVSDAEEQKDFVQSLDRAIKVVNTILEEYKLFGFDDFEPIKEKTETEWQIGSDRFGYLKKKKTN